MIQFDEPKLATGGNGGNLRPPVVRPFAKPEDATSRHTEAPRAARPSPELATALSAAAMARRAIRLHKLDRLVPRLRIALMRAEFKAALLKWQAEQPGYDQALQLQREHDSKIRRAFRSSHCVGPSLTA